jgi:hypothetical protein
MTRVAALTPPGFGGSNQRPYFVISGVNFFTHSLIFAVAMEPGPDFELLP